jgi:hypothetical protein
MLSFIASVPFNRRQAAHAAQQPATRCWDASSDQVLRLRTRHRLHACCAARHETAVQSDSQPGALPVGSYNTRCMRISTVLIHAAFTCLTPGDGHNLTSAQVLAAAAAEDAAALERQMQASLAAMEREDSGNAEGSSQTDPAAPGDADNGPFAGKRVAVLQATKQDAISIRERDRSLGAPPVHP